MNDSCSIMQDLFVPYLDETCSEESRELLEQHLKECQSCRKAIDNYKSPIPSVDVQENVKAEKPFKKIRRKMRFLIVTIVVLLIIILPVAVYQIYGHTHNFYEADRVFLGLDDSDFLNSFQWYGLEEDASTLYRKMYYTLQNRNGTAKKNATLSELVDESNMLNLVELDYKNAEIVYEEDGDYNLITLTIPLIIPNKDVPTVFQVTGSRTGCGKYSFTKFMLYPKNMPEENYVPLDFVDFAMTFDSLEIWPFFGFTDWVVTPSLGEKNLPVNNAGDMLNYTDTGIKIPSGVYVYEDDNGKETTLTIYDDGTLMRERGSKETDNSGFPYMYPNMLAHISTTENPCQYFIVEGEFGYELIIRHEKIGIQNHNFIEIMEDGNLRWCTDVYVKS